MMTQIMSIGDQQCFAGNPRLCKGYLLAMYLALLHNGFPMSPVTSPDIATVIRGITDDGSLREIYKWTATIDETLLNEARAHVSNGAV